MFTGLVVKVASKDLIVTEPEQCYIPFYFSRPALVSAVYHMD